MAELSARPGPLDKAGAVPAGRPRTAGSQRRLRTVHWGWLTVFLAPNSILFTIFIIIPTVIALGLSFFDWDMMSAPRFVGLANFLAIPRDARAINSIVKTAYLIAIGVIPTVFISFLLAALINTKFPFIRVIRTVYLLPLVISFVASAVLWRFIFDGHFGPINAALSWIGISGPGWLQSTAWSMPAVAIVVIWLRLPLGLLLYLAALQSINPSLIEAAQVDGANTWQRLRHVVWPNVRAVTFLVTIITLRGVLFDSFDVIQVMTGGGPVGSTDILIKYIFDAAFSELDMGYASALATVLFLMVALLALVLAPPRARGRRS